MAETSNALPIAYLMVTGAGVAGDVSPELITGLAARFERVLTVPTPNASRVLNLRDLSRLPKNEVVESYFAPSIMPSPPHGLVLVAPCTFNSLNHLAAGLSPNLSTAIVNEAIGRGTPVVVAIACNTPLWAHPAAPASAEALRRWGCHIVGPHIEGEVTRMAPVATILDAVDTALAGYAPAGRQ